MAKSSKISSTKPHLTPYWDEVCQMTSEWLWLPTAVDHQGQVVDEWCASASKTVAETWFSASLITPAQPTDFTANFAPALARLNQDFTGCGDSVTQSAMIRLYPTANQRSIFRQWFGVSRYCYNKTVEYLKTVEGTRGSWKEIANMIQAQLPDWTDEVPYQIKRIAIKDACTAYTTEKKKAKKSGKRFELSFRSKKNPKPSCYIPKTAVKPEGIYYTISGKGLIYAEDPPEFFGDCCLIYRQGRWYLQVPHPTTVTKGENQTRVVALDPGVRTFQTFYSPDMAGVLGEQDFGRLVRLCQHLDHLVSCYSQEKRKKRRYWMRKAADRMRWKIRELRDELHAKAARFLVDNFDIILIPKFETSQMVRKHQRSIRSKTVRSMLTWAHYAFRERLKEVAFQSGKTVIEVNEAYTSKTCSWSGEIVNVGSSEFIRGSDDISMHRDVNGARGIFLRALAELPSAESFRRALVNDVNNC